jgi:hypothetical protein
MGIYRPTWLYVKQHKITGLKYFGKTTRKNPLTYYGSGKYWKRHLFKHGKHVDTIWYKLFTDQEELSKFAMSFSTENRIVESSEWANCIPENGMDGGAPGRHLSEEIKQKISKSLAGKPSPRELTAAMSKRYSDGITKGWLVSRENRVGTNHPMYNKTHSPESKRKNSESNKNQPKFKCIHCEKSYQRGALVRWHGDNCRNKLVTV